MTRKIILLGFLLITVYFFYSPATIVLAENETLKSINVRPNQTFKLKDISELKNSQNRSVYIVLNHEDRKNLTTTIPKWKVLKSDNATVINDLLNCEFKYTGSDVATVQSKMYIYSNNKLIFESEISLGTQALGLQNSTTGWATPVKSEYFLNIINQFDRYNLPILIIN